MAKISEVIEPLEQLKASYGDLPVFVRSERGDGRILDTRHDIYRGKEQPGFLFDVACPECIIIDGDI